MKKVSPFSPFSFPLLIEKIKGIVMLKIEHRISVSIVMVVLASGCGYRQGELNGEIFIVTKGGENIRLGLITVQAIPEDIMKEYIIKKNAESKLEIEKLLPVYNMAKSEYEQAENDKVSSENETNRRRNLWFNDKNLLSGKSGRYYEEANKIYTLKNQIYLEKMELWAFLKRKINYYESANFYFQALPDTGTTVKTDADGRFKFLIQRNKRVALAAHATRHVFDNKEEYFWLIWASLDGESSKKILLSNDNMTDVGAKDSVIQTKY